MFLKSAGLRPGKGTCSPGGWGRKSRSAWAT
jgi:hypothetical protein